MSTKIKILEVLKKAFENKPGLVAIEIQDNTYDINLIADYYGVLTDDEDIDVELELKQTGSYDLFKDEDAFMREKNSIMTSQSIIPVGSFSIGQNDFKRSSQVFLNGKIVSVKEFKDNYSLKIECLNTIYYLSIDKNNKKPEVGNIISSLFNLEIVIEKGDQAWS